MNTNSDRTLKLPDDRTLAYTEYGAPSGIPIIYCHGSPGSRLDPQMFDQSCLVKFNARLIAPDRPGMGLSDFQPNRKISDWPEDVAALAAASRINISLYRETGQVVFLPDVYDTAQTYATLNSSYLASRSIPVTMTGVSIDEGSQTVSVSVTANLSALLPSVLNYKRQYTVIGYAKGRLDGR